MVEQKDKLLSAKSAVLTLSSSPIEDAKQSLILETVPFAVSHSKFKLIALRQMRPASARSRLRIRAAWI